MTVAYNNLRLFSQGLPKRYLGRRCLASGVSGNVWQMIGCVFILWTLIPLSAQAQTALQNAAHDLTTKLNSDSDVGKIMGQRVVITEFGNITGSGDAAPRLLQSMLTSEFIQSKRFKVVERSQLEKALAELKFGMSDLVDADKAKQIGKLVGASYILLGDMGQVDNTSTYISARLVSVETGESVAASTTTVKFDAGAAPVDPGATPTPNDVNPAAIASPDASAVTPAKPSAIGLDLSAKASSAKAGTWEGARPNSGLLGGVDFKIAWREDIGTDQIVNFASGDVKGNGINHLVMTEFIDRNPEIAVLRWEDGKFKKLWHDAASIHSGDLVIGHPAHGAGIIAEPGQFATWKWDGTSFVPNTSDSNYFVRDLVDGSKSKVVGYENQRTLFLGEIDWNTLKPQLSVPLKTVPTTRSTYSVTAGDYDGDGKAEFATSDGGNYSSQPGPIEILGQDGHRKGITDDNYDGIIRTWRPSPTAKPFIVAMCNKMDESQRSSGGFCCFIRWTGENYEEFWKSIPLDSQIVDFQVCDPKNEGQQGLVVLSTDTKNYYLTKIVLTN